MVGYGWLYSGLNGEKNNWRVLLTVYFPLTNACLAQVHPSLLQKQFVKLPLQFYIKALFSFIPSLKRYFILLNKTGPSCPSSVIKKISRLRSLKKPN